ncbi:MAG: prepilin-type N-terminal cleavage/methylation domain-containing protein [Deltaproteobacteria bacterium]|nr:prepilin-type N-terminal cleavage/methylation domain-containing protein [Deltaproteobacteria bacterium]
MKNKKRTGQQGFSLIEVMTGITILAVGILAVVSMQVTAIKSNAYSRQMTEGGNLALGKLEELTGLAYDNQLLSTAAGDNPHQEIRGRYNLQWTVADGPMSNTKRIDLQATWTEKGFIKRVNLTTIKADVI